MNDQQRSEHNKAAILAALRSAQVEAVTIEYSGSGDSGDSFDISPEVPSARVTQIYRKPRFDEAERRWVDDLVSEECNLARALENLHWQIVHWCGHGGWEINEGGGGTLTLDVATGTWSLEHYDNVVEKEHSSYAG